jgi:hypothetical protein
VKAHRSILTPESTRRAQPQGGFIGQFLRSLSRSFT